MYNHSKSFYFTAHVGSLSESDKFVGSLGFDLCEVYSTIDSRLSMSSGPDKSWQIIEGDRESNEAVNWELLNNGYPSSHFLADSESGR